MRRPTTRRRRYVVAAAIAPLLLAIVFAAAVPVARGQEGTDADSAALLADDNPLLAKRVVSVIAGLEEQLWLNAELIDTAVRAYRRAALQRNAALEALKREQARLDAAIDDARGTSAEFLDAIVSGVERARAQYIARDTELAHWLSELRHYLDQREALTIRITELRERYPVKEGELTGVWEVSWFPAGVKGIFYIDQNGTLVTGQYRLRTIGTGSLQGTFVGGKIFLQRIDGERGRDAELEGYLAPDGERIQGTWQSFELVQGGTPRGQWIANRVR